MSVVNHVATESLTAYDNQANTRNSFLFETAEKMDEETLESMENWILIGLTLTIVFLSLLFEIMLEILNHFLKLHKFESVAKMLNTLYRELTILGFISLTLFVFIHTGYAQQFNDHIFGVSETERVAIEEAKKNNEDIHPPTTLIEVFEDVHIFIFIVMVIFIFEGAILTLCGYHVMGRFDFYDKKTLSDLLNDLNVEKSQEIEQKYLDRELEFYGLKERFLKPTLPLIPSPTRRKENQPQFPFNLYLKKALGETLYKIIELPAPVLGAAIILVALLRPIMTLPAVEYISFMIYVAICLFSLSLLFLFWNIRVEMIIKPKSKNMRNFLIEYSAAEDINLIPQADIDLKPLVAKNIFGDNCHRTKQLFPFSRPLYMQRLMQIVLFLHAAYIAVLIRNITGIAHDSRHIWFINGLWAYPLTIIPAAASLCVWISVIEKYVLNTYLDCFVSQDLIDEVEKEVIGEEHRRNIQIINFLFYHAEEILISRITPAKYLQESEKICSKKEIDYINEIFCLIREKAKTTEDSEYSGLISKKALKDVVQALRISPEYNEADLDYLVEQWFKIFDSANSGYIEYGYYKIFFLQLSRLRNPKHQNELITARIKFLFEDMDKNNNNEVSHTDFRLYLRKTIPNLSEREEILIANKVANKNQNITYDSLKSWILLTLIRQQL